MTAELQALFIGDADYAEFRTPVAALARAARVHTAVDLAASAELLAGGLRPDVIIIAQQRPGEIASDAVEQLRRLAPLAPCIAIQSSWCDGEGRSGRPLPGVVRVPWRRFEGEIVPGLMRLRDGRLPDWAGPATLTPEERLLQQSAEPLPQSLGTVGILSHSHEARRLLEDICRSGGWSVAVLGGTGFQPVTHAESGASPSLVYAAHGQDGHVTSNACDVIVWDATELPEDLAPVMRRLGDGLGGASVMILLGFPRTQDIERASAAGAAAVIGKPFTAGELLVEINRVASRGSKVSRRQ